MPTDSQELPPPSFWVQAPPRAGLVLTETEPSGWDAKHPIYTAEQVRQAVLAERERWQPIATAPKDGTLIDLWAGERLPDCLWWGPEWADVYEHCWHQKYAEADVSFPLKDVTPTHWMRRPDPPKE